MNQNSWMQEIAIRYVNTWLYKMTNAYLNSSHLEAPREYVPHGLVPGLDWAPFWPLPMRMHLVATPSPVSCCLLQRFKFHTQRPCCLGGFSLMYKETSQQLYMTHGHMYIHHTDITIHSFLSSYTSSNFLGRLAVPDSQCPLQGCIRLSVGMYMLLVCAWCTIICIWCTYIRPLCSKMQWFLIFF